MHVSPNRPATNRLERGFTLLEAFIVLMIVAIMGIVTLPAIMNTLTHQKLASATNAFVNQVEFARVQAASRNRAYLLRVELASGSNSGAIHLDEGIGSACTLATFTTDGADPEPLTDVRVVDFTEEWEDVHIVEAEPPVIVEAGTAFLCVKPDGRVMSRDGTAVPAPPGYAAGEALFRVRLFSRSQEASQSSETDLAREIVVPYNGIPKVRNVTD